MIYKVKTFDTDELLLEFLEKNIGKIDIISTHNTPFQEDRRFGGSYRDIYTESVRVSVIYKEFSEIKRKEI